MPGAPEGSTGEDPSPISFPDANIVAVSAVAELLATALGPNSRDKLVAGVQQQDDEPRPTSLDEFVVTSDGAAILDALSLEHPIAPILYRAVGPERPGATEVEGADVHDGSTSTIVLMSSLLEAARSLLDRGMHPSMVQLGFRRGLDVALDTLESATRDVTSFPDDRRIKRSVAATAMTGNDVAGLETVWSELVVDAVDLVGEPDETSVVVRTFRTGSVADSRLIHGSVLDMNAVANEHMPRRIEHPSILVLGAYSKRGGLQNPRVRDDISLNVSADTPEAAFEGVFDDRRARIVDRIVRSGVDVVVSRSGIDRAFQGSLADHGIAGIRGVNQLDLRQVAAATGARVVSDPEDVRPEYLGRCDLFEERAVDRRKQRRKRRRITVFEGCPNPKSVTFLLRGVSGQIAVQADTQLRKAAAAVATASGDTGREPGVVPGGGAMESLIATNARTAALTHGSKVQLAMQGFADATERLVAILAKNSGLDPISGVAEIRTAREDGVEHAGFDLPSGDVVDAVDAGILDPAATRAQVYTTAVEVANLVLNVDDAIDSIDREEPPDPGDAIHEEAAEQQQRHYEAASER